MSEIELFKQYVHLQTTHIECFIHRIVGALHELERITLFLFQHTQSNPELIDTWLHEDGFEITNAGFYESIPRLQKFNKGEALPGKLSYAWGKHLVQNPHLRNRLYALRDTGDHLHRLYQHTPGIGLIYYQDVLDATCQYPFVDASPDIPFDFNWKECLTYKSVCPENNPDRSIQWTIPSVDVAGMGIVVTASIPIYVGDDFVGLWCIDVPVSSFIPDLPGFQIHERQEDFITDRDGNLLLHEAVQSTLGTEKGASLCKPLTSLGGGFTDLKLSGIPDDAVSSFLVIDEHQQRLMAFARKIPSLSWCFFSTIPDEQLTKISENRIKEALEKLGTGDFSHRISVDNISTNMQLLANTVNELATNLDTARSDKEKMAKALVESEENYKNLFQGVHDSIILHEINDNMMPGRILEANEYTCELLGYPKEELLGMTIQDIISAESWKNVAKPMKTLREERTFLDETTFVRRDGARIPMEVKGNTYILNGKPVVLASSRDISEPKKAYTALRNSEQKQRETTRLLQNILDAIPDVIGLQDNAHNIIQYNKAGYNFLNLTPDEVKGKKCYELIGKATACKECATSASYRTKKPARVERYFTDLDMWFDIRSYPVMDENNKVVQVIEHLRDITAHKNQQSELLKTNTLLRSLIENSPLAVIVVDCNGKIAMWSSTAEDMFGWKEEEVIGEINPCIPESKLEWYLDNVQFMVNEQAKNYLEMSTVRKDGSTIEVGVSLATFLDENTDVSGIISIVADITDRKHTERALLQSEEQFRSLYETMTQGVVYQDHTGRITSANPTAERIIGLPIQDMIKNSVGKTERSAIYEDGKPCAFEETPSMIALKTGKKILNRIVGLQNPLNGRTTWLRVSSTPQYKLGEDVPFQVYSIIEDITEQREAALELERTTLLFEAVLDQSPVPIVVGSSPDGVVRYINKATEKLLGITDEPSYRNLSLTKISEVKSWEEYTLDGDILQLNQHPLARALQGETSFNEEYTIICKDGVRRWVMVSGTPIYNKEKNLIAGLIIFPDISEMKSASEALQNKTAELEKILDSMSDAIIYTELDHTIRKTNPAFSRLFGYSPEEITGKSSNILYANSNDFVEQEIILTKYTDNDIREVYRVPYRKKDSSVFISETKSTVVINVNDEVDGYLFVVRDISERMLAEEERQRLYAAIEQAAEGVMITDPSGRIEYINPSYERISGYSREELEGRNPRLVKSGKHDREFYQDMWNTILSGEIWSGQITNRRKDGQFVIEDCSISPIHNDKGELTHFVAVKHDITKSVNLEEQFRQSQKMEAVGRLAGGVAHDLNNLLTPILGNAEMMKMDLSPNDVLNETLDDIIFASTRAKELVHQLLAFGRKQTLTVKSRELNKIVANFKTLLERTLRENIKIVFKLDPGSGTILVDSGQLEQVILNLAVNAQDAMPGGGSLTISTKQKFLDEDFLQEQDMKPSTYAIMTVSDTGTGMSEETIQQVFEPFFTTKELGQGTGLGLSTVYGIVKQHGGTVLVESELGKGTTFSVILPIVKENASTSPQGRETAQIVGGSETILIVEDEVSVRTVTATILKRLGYEVVLSETAEQCFELITAADKRIDMLLTDVVMPEINGRQLFTLLREIKPELKVLFMSGYTNDVIAEHGVVYEDIHFIQKPFTPRKLAEKIREVLHE